MKTAAQYLNDARKALGNARMSDAELGERLGGFGQSYISRAKRGVMTDPLALKIAEVAGIAPGEVLMVARLEREKDPAVKAALMEWAGKIFGLLSLEHGAVQTALAAGPNAPELALIDVAMPRATKRNAPHVPVRGVSIGGEGRLRAVRTPRFFLASRVAKSWSDSSKATHRVSNHLTC